ncbi:hypothetical protein [Cohnella soli]|uniref:Glycoside hydrolase family 42 N-terminal domain-containing protein n=1 Tax=Cohnella soli TaxID=425005 RepID=A0ABW0HSF6_9BACL
MSNTSGYAITFWGAPPVGHTNEQRYKEIAEAGFTLVTPPLRGPEQNLKHGSYEENSRILELCARFGMKAIIEDSRMSLALEDKENWKSHLDNIVNDYRSHPALEGYYIFDEPNATMFARLGAITAYLREIDPYHPGYINLFPNYATPEQLGTQTYREYVERYVDEVRPEMVSYDHYAMFGQGRSVDKIEISDNRERLIFESNTREERPSFFENIEIVREISFHHQLPFKAILLLVAHGAYPSPSEAQLRWQTFISLAYGASTISYFTYWTPSDEPIWHYRNAMFTWDGKKTDKYDIVLALNRELSRLGGFLYNRKSLGIYHVGEEREQVTYFHDTGSIREIAGGRAVAGYFEGAYWLIVNKDYERSTELTVTLEDGITAILVDKITGEERLLALHGNRCTLTFQPGDAELLRLEDSRVKR